MSNMQQPISVHVLWHPGDIASPTEDGSMPLPTQLFRMLHSDPGLPAGERVGIPAYLHTSEAGLGFATPVPPAVPLDPTHHTLVVAIIGNSLLDNDRWKAWIRDLRQSGETLPNVTFLPIALTAQ